MFLQIHMIQSMPPGNLNRDDSGQPKQCVFGGVTRGRISSQCLKRNIRLSEEFKVKFGDHLANRTQHLPGMVADELRNDAALGVPEAEFPALMTVLAGQFKKESAKDADDAEGEDGADDGKGSTGAERAGEGADKTPQLVFFPPPFARRIAELVAEFRNSDEAGYAFFLGARKGKKGDKKDEKSLKAAVGAFVEKVAAASKRLTVDIGLFGRMTTSPLVVDVEAACQVAHAIGTHETLIESDYFTAMDDRKTGSSAAFMGSGETETFFNSAVYYKYLNLDADALRRNLPSLGTGEIAKVAGALVAAAAFATPTGKQNGFASYGAPELILVEASRTRRPLSYANAFLQPVEGGVGRNLMTESAKSLAAYVDGIAAAFAPADTKRLLLAVGAAKVVLTSANESAASLDALIERVEAVVAGSAGAA